MSIQFSVLASGSRGNATLVRAGHAGLLIDFGLIPTALEGRLADVGSGWNHVAAALLTHTHGDHVNPTALRWFATQKVALYCHEGHRANLESKTGFRELDALGLVRHYDDRPFLTPNGMRVEAVELSHDGGPTFGFRVEARPARKARPVAVGYLADTGTWTDAVAEAMSDVAALGVEFNHDVDLQRRSGRASYLIARNLGPRGHLSNDQGANLVASVLRRSAPGSLRHVVLLHLSEQCNRPVLAIDRANEAIRESGRKVAVHAARQRDAFPDLRVAPGRKPRAVAHGASAGVPCLFPWEVD